MPGSSARCAEQEAQMIEAKAVRIVGKGDVDVLRLGTLPIAEPGPSEMLVRIAAAGLNRADCLQRRGFYPAPAGVVPDVPGLEYAGHVESVGEGVRAFAPGDAVMGIVGGGAMATHIVVHEREAVRVPTGMPIEEAAAIPEVFMTAYDAVFAQAQLRMGETLLVHAIGSGVGTAALQLGLCAGARVIGTSRTQDKLARCRELGLTDGLCVQDKTFAKAVQQVTGERGADVILDTIGAAYLAENIAALAPCGRVVVIGLLGGATGELSLGALLAKRAHVMGSVLRSRALEEKATLAQAFTREVLPLFEQGKLKPIVDSIVPMSDVQSAHQRMEKNDSFGKIVLRW
jgi:putative PIG3 family NAD(P)H quinone oxidoreductase